MFILRSLFKRNELRDFESSLLRKKKKRKKPCLSFCSLFFSPSQHRRAFYTIFQLCPSFFFTDSVPTDLQISNDYDMSKLG